MACVTYICNGLEPLEDNISIILPSLIRRYPLKQLLTTHGGRRTSKNSIIYGPQDDLDVLSCLPRVTVT